MIRVPRIYKSRRILILVILVIFVIFYTFQISFTSGNDDNKSVLLNEINDLANDIELNSEEAPDLPPARDKSSDEAFKELPKLDNEMIEKVEEEILYRDEAEFSRMGQKDNKHSKGFTKHASNDDDVLSDNKYESLPIVYDRLRQGKKSPNFVKDDDVYRIPLQYEFKHPLEQILEIPTTKKDFHKIQSERYPSQESRFSAVKSLFIENWNQYFYFSKKYDSFKPLSLKGENDYIGWSMTLIDSLDTLFIMGFFEEFEMAVTHIDAMDFHEIKRDDIPLFETNIRILGGLLSAFDLSEEYRLLDNAKIIAEILLRAFDTETHFPILYYNLEGNQINRDKHASMVNYLSELGSLSLEFTRLSIMTNDMRYYTYVMNLIDKIIDAKDDFLIKGLIPNELDLSGCELVFKDEDVVTMFNGELPEHAKRVILVYDYNDDNELAYCIPSNKIKATNKNQQVYSMEGKADSFYEYLLKLYILLNGNLDEKYLEFFQTAKEKIKKFLIFKPKMKEDGLKFLNEITVTNKDSHLEITQHNTVSHLSCFAGGFFTLVNRVLHDPTDLQIGKDLTRSCYQITKKTGLFPESFMVDSCDDLVRCEFDEQEKINFIQQHTTTTSKKKKNKPPERIEYIITDDDDLKYKVKTSSKIPYSPIDPDTKIWKTGEAMNQPLEFNDMDPRHLLRPELIESLFINYRITGFDIYREQAWEIFQKIVVRSSIEVKRGNDAETVQASIRDVTNDNEVIFENELESWWFAETLKYFYLIFQDSKVLSLDEWVFNTQGHPLKKEKFWLTEYQ